MLTLAPCPKWCRVCRRSALLVPPHPALSPNSQQALRSQGACHPLIGKTCERDFCQRKSTTTIQCVRSYRELAEQIRHRQMKGFPRRLIPCHQQIQRPFYTKTMWMTIRRGRLVNWVELGDQPGWPFCTSCCSRSGQTGPSTFQSNQPPSSIYNHLISFHLGSGLIDQPSMLGLGSGGDAPQFSVAAQGQALS